MSLLQRIDDPCKYSEDIQQLEIHAHKINRLPEQSAVVASFQTELPPSLEGPKESRERSKPFGAMPSYDHWDPGDGQTGPMNRINQTMDMRNQSIYSNIEQIMEAHPLGRSLCHEMLRLSVAFWRDLCSEIAEFNRFLLVSSYGADGPYTAAAKEQRGIRAGESCLTSAKLSKFQGDTVNRTSH